MCFVLKPLCLILADCSFYNANGQRLVLGFPLSAGHCHQEEHLMGADVSQGRTHSTWGLVCETVVLWPLWVSCIWCCLNSFLGCMTVEKWAPSQTNSSGNFFLDFFNTNQLNTTSLVTYPFSYIFLNIHEHNLSTNLSNLSKNPSA